jgi:hypothetical protein
MLGRGACGYPANRLMEPGFLYAIAGVSMSMAGFTGLVAALRRAEAVRAQHLFWIGIILWHCLAATFLALFPVTLYALWPDAAGVLRVSSAILAVFALERFWRSLQSRRFWRPSVGLIAVGTSIRTVDSLLALVNVAVGSLGLYELALLLLLGMPAYSFGLLFTFGLDAPTDREARPPTGS